MKSSNGYPVDIDKAIQYHCRSIYFGGQWSPQALSKIVAMKSMPPISTPKQRPLAGVWGTAYGSGKYDRMTYDVYESTMEWTPAVNVEATSLNPHLWYCNGICTVDATIQSANGVVLEKLHWHGLDVMRIFLGFDKPIVFKAGQTYTFALRGSTTKSIGVLTTGADQNDSEHGKVHTVAARYPDRGAIGFHLFK